MPGQSQRTARSIQPAPDLWAGLHDNVPADLLPRWQKVRQSRATQSRCTNVRNWATTSAMQPTSWDSDSCNFKCHGRQLAPNRCSLGGGSVWDLVVQPSPDVTCTLRNTLPCIRYQTEYWGLLFPGGVVFARCVRRACYFVLLLVFRVLIQQTDAGRCIHSVDGFRLHRNKEINSCL